MKFHLSIFLLILLILYWNKKTWCLSDGSKPCSFFLIFTATFMFVQFVFSWKTCIYLFKPFFKNLSSNQVLATKSHFPRYVSDNEISCKFCFSQYLLQTSTSAKMQYFPSPFILQICFLQVQNMVIKLKCVFSNFAKWYKTHVSIQSNKEFNLPFTVSLTTYLSAKLQKFPVAFMLHLFFVFFKCKTFKWSASLLFRILQNETKPTCQWNEANDLNLPFLHRLCSDMSCFVVFG